MKRSTKKVLYISVTVILLLSFAYLFNNIFMTNFTGRLVLDKEGAVINNDVFQDYYNSIYLSYSGQKIKYVDVKDEKVINSSPNGVPSDYKHGEVTIQASKYYPPNWIHSTSQGISTFYYPPGAIHITTGTRASEYKNWPSRHDGYLSQSIDDWWLHIETKPFASYYYDPQQAKHIGETGPMLTRYVPLNWVHATADGPFKSMYFPPEYKHISDGGPMNSYYLPNEGYVHIAGKGPMQSMYVPQTWIHISGGNNTANTYYVPPKTYHDVITTDWKVPHQVTPPTRAVPPNPDQPLLPGDILPWVPKLPGSIPWSSA